MSSERNTAFTVLMIDDEVLGAEMIQHMLNDQCDVSFHAHHDATTALEIARTLSPAVVLVDLRMPLMDGFGLIRTFRQCPDMAQVPIVMLSSQDDPELKARGFAEGANDYMVKWPDRRELVARVRYHAAAYLARRDRDAAFRDLEQSRQALLERTQELAESQAALYQAQKMEAVGNLTGGIAHDFNNVLQIISGALNLIKLQTSGNDQIQKRVHVALDGVARGSRLSSQLLSFARRQPLQPHIIDLRELINDASYLLGSGLGVDTRLHIELPDNLWPAFADAGKLENVLFNLAINARDAMPHDGTILLRASNTTIMDNHARRLACMPGDYIRIDVVDSGTGMSQEVKDHAFEPFFTTKAPGQGTGLGLSMAYGFAKQSGGHIEIESREGHGTTVSIYLPRSQAAPPEHGNGQLPASAGCCGSETILVVEDEQQVRDATSELLRSLGYTVLQAEDGQSALRVVESGETIDLIFTDVVMPGPLRSVDFVALAHERLPDVPVLFTSGYVRTDILKEWSGQSNISLLSKPYNVDALASCIRNMLGERRYATGLRYGS